MAILFKAPAPIETPFPKVFLAGSIEMGQAENWQDSLASQLENTPVALLNPRREAWDDTWEQKADHPQFREQVLWELTYLENAHLVVFYFQPGTQSPISLLELGLFHHKAVVCCPEGFWRKGNVDLVCEKYRMQTIPCFSELALYIKSYKF